MNFTYLRYIHTKEEGTTYNIIPSVQHVDESKK